MSIASPCIKVCTLDAAGELCLGCFRTLDEIGRWAQLPDAARAAVMEQLPERRRRHDSAALARCDNCGAPFHCGAQDAQPCWCTAYPPVAPASPDARCLCPFCLAALAAP